MRIAALDKGKNEPNYGKKEGNRTPYFRKLDLLPFLKDYSPLAFGNGVQVVFNVLVCRNGVKKVERTISVRAFLPGVLSEKGTLPEVIGEKQKVHQPGQKTINKEKNDNRMDGKRKLPSERCLGQKHG